MSLSKRLTWNEHGDPTLTVTVVGSHDVFRFADHLTRGQVEFAALGFKTQAGMKRKWGAKAYGRLHDYFYGSGIRR
jgi:hypothetical protein